jgi:hypothetical protein
MKSSAAHKAMTCAEEKVSIVRRKSGKSIEGKTVDSNGHGGREHRTFIESEPVGTMVIGHWILNYPGPIHPFLYTRYSVKDVSLSKCHQTKGEMKGVERTNMGLAHTIGEGTECPGIGSSQIPIIHSLPDLCHHITFTVRGTPLDLSSFLFLTLFYFYCLFSDF